MPLRHLNSLARRVNQLERARLPGERARWPLEKQAQLCRGLLAACCRGEVERTPQGYRAITDNNGWREPFELEPGRWEKRAKILPEEAARCRAEALLLNVLFNLTGKYFPVDAGIARQSDAALVEAVYRHYGGRVFAFRE